MRKPKFHTYWLMYSQRYAILPVLDVCVGREHGQVNIEIEIRWWNRWSAIEVRI